MRWLIFHAGVALLWCMSPAVAQETSQRESETQAEILVEGELLSRAPVVELKKAPRMTRGTRQLAGHSEVFARCVKQPNIKLMRRIVDGPPNSANMRAALDFIIRTNKACYPSFPVSQYSTPALGTCNPAAIETVSSEAGIPPPSGSMYTGDQRLENALTVLKRCRAIFDYGALLMKAMETYAPNLALSTAQTQNPIVVDRFLARERPRNRYRVETDRHYFAVTSCMVQREPELAVRLYRLPLGGDMEPYVRQALIDRTRECTQNAKTVTVDPSEFRVYIADSIYRWYVAVKGSDSLLPSS